MAAASFPLARYRTESWNSGWTDTGFALAAARASRNALASSPRVIAVIAAESALADRSGWKVNQATTNVTAAISVAAPIVPPVSDGALRPTGRTSGPRPASQPAQTRAATVVPGMNHVQSM